jgi:DNA repair protein RadA/Sms
VKILAIGADLPLGHLGGGVGRTESSFECQGCGYGSAKWLGRCPDCGSWNSFVEAPRAAVPKRGRAAPRGAAGAPTRPARMSEISSEDAPRIPTSDAEFDRVLGGGVVPGSVVLLGGEPGAGKSTLMLQLAQNLQAGGRRVLYVSGEESAQQIKLRAARLDLPGADIFLLAEAGLERILGAVDELRPTDLVVDSIQTTFSSELDSSPGSISQVRHVAMRLLELAKSRNIPVFLIGHVTKDGSLAGPKALEHIVDAVLYFEGERQHNHRIIRAVKNRFGAANEIGVFEMTARGLVPAASPSNLFLRERHAGSPGSAVACALQGTRPILVEIQALVGPTQYGTARRLAAGVDPNRIAVLVAMLEKRLETPLLGCDIYVNAAGGMEIDEPAADLAIASAILSSFRNRPVWPSTVLLGELGLAGEARPISQAALRVREAASLGFRRAILPDGNLPMTDAPAGLTIVPIASVATLMELLFDVSRNICE